MRISEQGLNIIKEFESYGKKLPDGRCTAYREYLGNGKYDIPTIGWGCTKGVQMGMIWTVEEAETALRKEITATENGVTPLLTFTPTQDQFDALVSFAYNVGVEGLHGSTVLRLANAGDFHGAASAFLMWNKAQGIPLPGLTRRRHEEAALFLSSEPAKMPKTIDPEPDLAVETVPSRADPDTGDEAVASPGATAAVPQPIGNTIDRALAHAEAHKDLLASSWSYWTTHFSIKTIVGASAGTLAFAKDYALLVASVALLAIVGFELVRYMQRNKAIGAH